jgi:hypothetical protein
MGYYAKQVIVISYLKLNSRMYKYEQMVAKRIPRSYLSQMLHQTTQHWDAHEFISSIGTI